MMKLRLILLLSLRHFLNKEKKSSRHLRGAAVGIGIAIVPVIIVLIAGNGLIEGITTRYQELSSGQIQIRGVRSAAEGERLISEIDTVPEIEYAGQFYEKYGLISVPQGNAGAVIRGIPDNLYTEDAGFRENIVIEEGHFATSSEDSILLSSYLAEKLRLSPGDRVRLIISREFGRKVLFKPVSFKVTGIFSTGYYELDTSTVYISASQMHSLYGNDLSGYITVKTKQESVEQVLHEIRVLSGSDVTVIPWYYVNNAMYENFTSTKSSLLIIMLLIVGIAGLSVSSSVYMLAMEQREEIAFLKAVGLDNSMVSKVFLVSGGLTGTIGGFLGIFCGLLMGVQINNVLRGVEWIINSFRHLLFYIADIEYYGSSISIVGGDFYLDEIPVMISYSEILLVFSVAISVSVIGAILPAHKASRIPPIDLISKK